MDCVQQVLQQRAKLTAAPETLMMLFITAVAECVATFYTLNFGQGSVFQILAPRLSLNQAPSVAMTSLQLPSKQPQISDTCQSGLCGCMNCRRAQIGQANISGRAAGWLLFQGNPSPNSLKPNSGHRTEIRPTAKGPRPG